MKKQVIGSLSAAALCAALIAPAFAAQAPRGAREGAAARGAGAAPRGAAEQAPPPESRIIQDGDLEILTFESEENYRELQKRLAESQKSLPKNGTHTVQYFRSAMDGSVQPYSLWVPKDYDKNTAYPMVVQLHGISRTDGVANKRVIWEGMRYNEWVDPYTPVIHAQPLGRTNNFYSIMGEEDVLEVIREVKRRFNIDSQRVFLMGHSMGGAGTLNVGMHYPDMFGSLTPIDAAGGLSADNKFLMNLFNQNVYIKDAGGGIGGRGEDTKTPMLIEAGAFATREVFPGMPHHFAPQRPYSMFVPQAIQQPIPVNAPEVKFYTNNLRYNSAYWITVDQLVDPNGDSTLHAVYDDGIPEAPRGGAQNAETQAEPTPVDPSISITTENIAGLTLKLAGAVVPEDASMPVKINGQTVLEGKLPEVAHVAMVDGAWKSVDAPALAGKRNGLQGPVADAFMTSFLAVYGEGEGAKELAIAELDNVRSRGTFHGDFPMKSAAKLTKEDVENYSLILFGGPEANSVVKRIADKLPASLLEGPHDGANGVVMILPNPENPQRYAVVWTAKLLSAPPAPAPEGEAVREGGRGGGGGGGRGSSLGSLRDYTVVREGRVAQSGNFNNSWQLD